MREGANATGPVARRGGGRDAGGDPFVIVRPGTLVVAVIAAAASVAVSISGGSAVVRAPDRPAARTAFADPLVRFPQDTASDVVSYSDHVALVTAVSEVERTDEVPPARAAAGEYDIYRRVTFHVDRLLWSHPGVREAPRELAAVWWGWTVAGGERTRLVASGATWVEVGSSYVMPIAWTGERFAPIQSLAVFPYDGTAVRPSESQHSALATELAGRSAAETAAAFARAVPDPAAVRHRDLLPDPRLDAATGRG